MNKINKFLIGIIFILIIALTIITIKYFKQRDLIYEYMGNYNFSAEQLRNNVNN